MGMSMKAVIFLGVLVVGLISMASAELGTATFFTRPRPRPACRITNPGPGVMIAAASPAIFDNGTACGRMYRIRCIGPIIPSMPRPCRGRLQSVTVKIVDVCRGCPGRSFNLSRQAFSRIADPAARRIRIDYNRLP